MTTDGSQWRLIPCINAGGSVQMAIDLWLLQQHQLGHQSTLRFYTWSPPAISLGYHQRKYPQAWQHLNWQGKAVELVRRPTGGRAVLHQGDLTYAVVTSGLSGSRVQVYQQICAFLIQGWRSLGVELHYGKSGRGYIHNPNCFGTATDADLLLADGTKFIGSAQLIVSGAILQHGSMLLHPDAAFFKKVFATDAFNSIYLPKMQVQTIIDTLVTAANRCFNIQLVLQPFSPSEWQDILNTIDRNQDV